ncbi:MAG: FAD-dependent oxidoreductase [Rikenellaceae bacterium]
MKRRVIIIGGGVAGMQTALQLHRGGIETIIVEKSDALGGKVNNWYLLFPTFTPAKDVVNELRRDVAESGIECRMSSEVVGFTSNSVELKSGEKLRCDVVVVASGFTLFDAKIKEEYGYGIYPNVYTTPDIERMFIDGTLPMGEHTPKRIALLHCVGSRDEKVCQSHCSKVCCVTGVKQAVELKKHYPKADIFNFYMDIRMFGAGYEEMYRDAQISHNIHFVRGRISEAAPTIDNRIQIKAEDTLTARPLRMNVDMLILIVGMRANDSNSTFALSAGIEQQPSKFMKSQDHFLHNTSSGVDGIFYAGCVTAPKNIGDSLNDAMHAAEGVRQYLSKL